MARILYELCGAEGRRFSPYCWRARMALAHKGLSHLAEPLAFTDIPARLGGISKTAPVLDDEGKLVADSWAIACHLEDAYPDRASLFGGAGGRAMAKFIESWTITELHPRITRLIITDLYARVCDEDRAYFRQSREARYGRPLEEVQVAPQEGLPAFREALAPLRQMLKRQPFIGGERPLFADYIVFGALQWARVMSPLRLVADDDPVSAWFARCLDLHNGLGRAQDAAA